MKTSVSIPIHGSRISGQNVQVKFPRQCLYCGGNPETEIMIDLYDKSPAKGNKVVEYIMYLHLPYCREHAGLSTKLKEEFDKWTGIIAIAAVVIIILSWIIFDISSESFFVPLALGGIALVVGYKLLVTVSPKFRELPALGQEGALGLRVKLNTTASAATRLDFWFSNAEYAAKFARENNVRVSPA